MLIRVLNAFSKAQCIMMYPDVFMGPVCPYVLAPVARYSGVWKIPVVTTGGQAGTFRNKTQYPLLTTIGGAYEQFAVFFTKLLKLYEWYTHSAFP